MLFLYFLMQYMYVCCMRRGSALIACRAERIPPFGIPPDFAKSRGFPFDDIIIKSIRDNNRCSSAIVLKILAYIVIEIGEVVVQNE